MTMRASVIPRPDLNAVQVAVYDDDEDSSLFYDVLLDPTEAASFAEQARESVAEWQTLTGEYRRGRDDAAAAVEQLRSESAKGYQNVLRHAAKRARGC